MYRASPRCISQKLAAKLKVPAHVKRKEGEETLCDWMWNETQNIANQALNTIFIQGIKNGVLDPTGFGGYMVQDAVYCERAQEALTVAAGKECDEDLKEFIQEKANSYKSYYEALYEDWHIRDASGIDLGEECQTYANVLTNTANNDDPLYLLVASLPCGRLWPWLGEQLNGGQHAFGPYAAWVKDNLTGEGYKKVEDRVNHAYSEGQVDKEKAMGIYMQCMNGELGFFGSVTFC